MNRSPVFFGALAAVMVLAAPVSAGGIPAETLKEIKAATVFVKVGITGPGLPKILPTSGSGFVMMVDGDVALIVTNEHVITVPKDLPRLKLAGPPTVVFHSGTNKEFSLTAEIVAIDSERDLAVLRVKTDKALPKAIPIDPKVEVNETMAVYSFGFPFGQALSTTKGNPAITVGKGAVSSIRNDEYGKVKVVQIDGDLNPGNSGGPVVDDKGKLVGVAVAKIEGTRIGMAIPSSQLSMMLLGRVGRVGMVPIKMDKDQAEILVDSFLIDPLKKVKDVSIKYVVLKDSLETPKMNKVGRFPTLVGTTQVDLKIKKYKAGAIFGLVPKQTGKVKFAYQIAYTNADGTMVHTDVIFQEIDFSGTFLSDSLTDDDDTDKVTKKAAKIHVQPLKANKTYIIDMMGDPNRIDPFLRLEDSKGKEVATDDDGGGGLNARIIYTPNRDDDFKIIATTLRGTGDYSLRITEELPIQVGKGIVITSALNAKDPIIRTPRVVSHYKIFKVDLVKDKTYTIDLLSNDFQPYVNISGLTGGIITLNTAKSGGNRTSIVHTASEGGTHKIQVVAYDSRDGKFTLTIREAEGPIGKTPKIDPKIYEVAAEGLTIESELAATDAKDKKLQSAARIFQVKLEANQKYVIDMKSQDIDSFLRLEDAKGKQLAEDDDGGGFPNARIFFTPTEDGTYRLTALAFDRRLGAFTITVRKD